MKENVKLILIAIAYIIAVILLSSVIMCVIIGIPAYAVIQIIEAIKN